MTSKNKDRMEEWMTGLDGSVDDCEDKGQDGGMDDRIEWKNGRQDMMEEWITRQDDRIYGRMDDRIGWKCR